MKTDSKTKTYDLEERLIDFAVRVITVVEALPDTKAGRHIAGQLVRSGTSPAPNYGEAQSAESVDDFVHKLKIALKELAVPAQHLDVERIVQAEPAAQLSDALGRGVWAEDHTGRIAGGEIQQGEHRRCDDEHDGDG